MGSYQTLPFNVNEMAKKKINQPTNDEQRDLLNVMINGIDYCELRGRKIGLRWTTGETLKKITSVMLDKNGDESKVSCKCAAAIILRGWFKMKMFYWILWRWFYFVKGYGDHELKPLIELAQKKTPVTQYYEVMTLLTGLKITKEIMTREEVQRIQTERIGVSDGK